MNLGTTVAFDNSAKFWKTRYSFVPTRYAYLDKKMLTCKGWFQDDETAAEGPMSSNAPLAWRHDERTASFNNFYNQQSFSMLKTSFNKDLSANKLFKSLSLEGTYNLRGGISRFLANSTSQITQLKDASVGRLEEKGGILYADIGRGRYNSPANVEVVGVVRGISPLFSADYTGPTYGHDPDPQLVKIDIDFTSKSFNTSNEFKLVFQSSAYPLMLPDFYEDIDAPYIQPGSSGEESVYKGNNCLIARDLGMEVVQNVENVTETIITPGELIASFDANQDGWIGTSDLLSLLTLYGQQVDTIDGISYSDINQDGQVNLQDLLDFLPALGTSAEESNVYSDDIVEELVLETIVTETYTGYLDLLNAAISAANAAGYLILAVMVTPSDINGRSPKGQYADLFLNIGGAGNEDFELDIINLNYEHTRLDHSS